MREEALAAQLRLAVQTASLPDVWAEQMLTQIEEWKHIEAQASGAAAQPLKEKLAALEAKLDRLLDAHLEGLISREEYAKRKEKLVLDKSAVSARLAAVERQGHHWLEPLARFVRAAPSRSLTGSGNPAHAVASTENLDSLKEWTIRIGSNLRLAGLPRACRGDEPCGLLMKIPGSSWPPGALRLEEGSNAFQEGPLFMPLVPPQSQGPFNLVSEARP